MWPGIENGVALEPLQGETPFDILLSPSQNYSATVSKGNNWLSIISGAQGSGTSVVVVSHASNTGIERFGEITVQIDDSLDTQFAIGISQPASSTGVGLNPNAYQTSFELGQNFPNPFRLSTSIKFNALPHSHVNLTVYDVLGRRVGVLYDGTVYIGPVSVSWDANGLTSGIYFYQMKSERFIETKAMTLIE